MEGKLKGEEYDDVGKEFQKAKRGKRDMLIAETRGQDKDTAEHMSTGSLSKQACD